MKIGKYIVICKIGLLCAVSCVGVLEIFADYIPEGLLPPLLLLCCGAILLFFFLYDMGQKHQESDFSNDICETVDALMEGRELENFHPYEETASSKVQEKLLQYYDKMKDEQRQSMEDKQTIQELVSDISHQVKTPLTNLQMFTGILQQHEIPKEKQIEFLNMMAAQVNKLNFLMQSLIKMSRLETGTFVLHMESHSLYQTIARAVESISSKAEAKNIQIEVVCDSKINVKHDTKWTAEALGNILDNGVKYTPENGTIRISVRPWQFYTRIDIADTGIGIAEEHYNDVFQRFYRAEEVAAQEGVGLGLYLARSIIIRQKGYISVKSKQGKGSVFSVFLLS